MPTASTLQEVAREHIKINAKGKGGNTKFTCNHCKREFTGSQTRQLAHLTGTSGSGVAACQHIDGDLRKAIKTEVDRLERVKSPLFKKMCEAISNSNVTYKGPAYNAMRTDLLDAVKCHVEKDNASWSDHGKNVTGFVLGSDRWTDAQSRPLMNLMLVTPRGTKFVRALDISGNEESAEYIADKMSEVIDEVGPEHITAVIMESASNNVSANEILEERYGCLFTLHCTAHALDLALESICELPYFSQPVAVSKKVIKVLTNHDSTSALFKSRSKLFLLKPGDTSCHSAYIAVRRLLRCQNAVRSTVYPECLAIETHIENCTLPEDVRLDVFVIFHKRWNNMHSPLHSVAYMLEPQVQGTDFGAAVRKDFRDGVRRMVETSDEYKAVLSQHAKFTNKEGIYGDEDIMSLTQDDSEHSILTYQFWAEYGQSAL
ncbi:MAG: hypothetical protein FRX49_04420 [Trebouxia sp. A1-2]|nr:MAG: hypothetical protein FRX49_04420 [Trebouxia sp. A1-2]